MANVLASLFANPSSSLLANDVLCGAPKVFTTVVIKKSKIRIEILVIFDKIISLEG